MTRVPLLAALVAAGCGGTAGPPPNKSGAAAAIQPALIQIESPNGAGKSVEYFAKRVAALSGGELKVYVSERFPSGEPGNETHVGRMVRAGEVDFALLPGRTWSAVGAPAFAALQAPFVLTSFDATRRALIGPAGAALKADLEHAGVVPLYLTPSHPRRFLTLKPLAGPEPFRGLRIRLYDEATTAASVQALGARPIQGISTDEVLKRLQQRRLDGLETPAGTVLSYDYWRAAHHLTAYAMFSGIDTFVASSAAWKRLSVGQRKVIRAAAQDTARADLRVMADDADRVETLCSTGVRLTDAGAAQLRGLADATESVRVGLRKASATAAVMRALEATPGAGPQMLAAPDSCAPRPARAPARPDDAAKLPEGTYVTQVMPGDTDADGNSYIGPERGLKSTMRLKDGTWTRTFDPVPPGQVGDVDGAGTYEVSGNEVTFRYTHPRVDATAPEVLRWSYYNGRLSFKPVRIIDRGMRVVYSAHPWHKQR